jgi:hypothetical protein
VPLQSVAFSKQYRANIDSAEWQRSSDFVCGRRSAQTIFRGVPVKPPFWYLGRAIGRSKSFRLALARSAVCGAFLMSQMARRLTERFEARKEVKCS